MKFAFKSLIAAAAFIAAGAASATTVTITVGNTVYKGVKLSGSETLTFSLDAIGAFDTLAAFFTPYSDSVVSAVKDQDGFFTNVSATMPIASLNVDDTTDQALSVASTSGLSIAVPLRKSISSGAAMTVSDLNVDLANKVVYATVSDSSNTTPVTNVPLWTFSTITGGTAVVPTGGASGTTNFSVSGLALTTAGFNQVVSSLKLLGLGRAVMQNVPDFGTVGFSLEAVRQLPACSVAFKTTDKNRVLFNTEVTVTNHTNNPATGWQVNWGYNKPTLLIAPKNAKLTDKNLKSYTAKPVAANTTIAAGGSTTFSFKGHANDGAPVLGELAATVGGLECAVSEAL